LIVIQISCLPQRDVVLPGQEQNLTAAFQVICDTNVLSIDPNAGRFFWLRRPPELELTITLFGLKFWSKFGLAGLERILP
jgi:hypothetical protein